MLLQDFIIKSSRKIHLHRNSYRLKQCYIVVVARRTPQYQLVFNLGVIKRSFSLDATHDFKREAQQHGVGRGEHTWSNAHDNSGEEKC